MSRAGCGCPAPAVRARLVRLADGRWAAVRRCDGCGALLAAESLGRATFTASELEALAVALRTSPA